MIHLLQYSNTSRWHHDTYNAFLPIKIINEALKPLGEDYLNKVWNEALTKIDGASTSDNYCYMTCDLDLKTEDIYIVNNQNFREQLENQMIKQINRIKSILRKNMCSFIIFINIIFFFTVSCFNC